MDTNKILRDAGYSGANFGKMAMLAHELDIEGVGKDDILDFIEEKFGKAVVYGETVKPFSIYGDIDENTIDQMSKVMRLPMATRGALMPDAHFGYAMPIGGVVELENAISPSFVGYDISCQVVMTVLNIDVDDFMKNRDEFSEKLRFVTRFGTGAHFESPNDHSVMYDSMWNDSFLKQLKPLAQSQLGSSGAGNHFADLMIGELVEPTEYFNRKEFVCLMTHSGSRGVGHKVASKYMKLAKSDAPSGYQWLEGDIADEYFEVMKLMGRYTDANHDIIHDSFSFMAGIKQASRFRTRHNFAWKEGNKYIHRKGATPSHLGEVGLIAGTSGTPSYMVEGLGNEDSLMSSSHGAGRPFSRTEAKRRHDEDYVNSWMKEHDILSFGLTKDESLMAYKNIEEVMANQKELVKPIAILHPSVVIMGGEN